MKGGIFMPDINKMILKMKRQPNGIRFQEIEKVLEYNGYTMKSKTRNIASTVYKRKRRCDNN